MNRLNTKKIFNWVKLLDAGEKQQENMLAFDLDV